MIRPSLPPLFASLILLSACSGEQKPDEASQAAAQAQSSPAQTSKSQLPELSASIGHSKPISHLHYNADGRFLITQAEDGLIVWEAKTRRELRRLVTSHGSPMSIHAELPDGRLLLQTAPFASANGFVEDNEWALFETDSLTFTPLPATGRLAHFDAAKSELFLNDDGVYRIQLATLQTDHYPDAGQMFYVHPSQRWVLGYSETELHIVDVLQKTTTDLALSGLVIAPPSPADNPIIWGAARYYASEEDGENGIYSFKLHQVDLAEKKILQSFNFPSLGVSADKIEILDDSRVAFHGYSGGGVFDLKTQTFARQEGFNIIYDNGSKPPNREAAVGPDQLLRLAESTDKGRTFLHAELVDRATNTVVSSTLLGRDTGLPSLAIDPRYGIDSSHTQAVFYNAASIVVVDLQAAQAKIHPLAALRTLSRQIDFAVFDRQSSNIVIAAHEPDTQLVSVNSSDASTLTAFGSSLIRVKSDIASSASGIWAADQDGFLLNLRFDPQGVKVLSIPDREASNIVVSADGSTIATYGYENWSTIVSPANNPIDGATTISVHMNYGYAPDKVTLSHDGSLVAIANSELFQITHVATDEPVLSLSKNPDEYGVGPNGDTAFSPDNRIVLIRSRDESNNSELLCFQLAEGEQWAKRLWSTPVESKTSFSASADGSSWTLATETELIRLDLLTGEELDRQPKPTQADTPETHFATNIPDLLVSQDDNPAFLSLWKKDAGKSRYLGKLAFFERGSKYLLIDAQGHFDATPGMEENIYYVIGNETIALGAAYSKLYTPRLYESLLAGLEIPAPLVTPEDLAFPPTITLRRADGIASSEVASETISLTADAFSPRGAIQEIQIFKNGKRIGEGTRGLVVEDDADDSLTSQTRSYTIALDSGPNEIKAIAINESGIESSPATLVLQHGEAAPAGGIRLHVLAVGINEYKNPKYNLNYASADANAVVASLKERSPKIFSSVETELLLNTQATRGNLLAAFERIAAKATSRDAFLFYYAGHGVVSETAGRLFFLVPTDVTQMYGDDQQLASHAISSAELLELSKKLPAQKQLFILDACQSAGALAAVGVRGAAEERAIAQLARSSGTHWLTASGSQQFAAEFEKLGHGVFTYALLAALSGEADAGDGRVTVNDLKAYLESRVPDLTLEYRGAPQYPASFGYGQDFPLTLRQ